MHAPKRDRGPIRASSLPHARHVSTRLQAQFPDLADALQTFGEDERAALVAQIASHAASITGLVVPEGSTAELGQRAADLDEARWTTDSTGEPVQDQPSFNRARAAFAVRDACAVHERPDAAADSLYESVIAIGLPAVRAHLA